ncbi:MAG: nodulation protein NfeD [Gammaproteobacteria bacterium]|nr:nodulation protein NfeD [Gammaproteobacteria bacterium]MBU6509779.1 nodulation protein NfeD [Gammaproteobacteria bacterium]MDE1983591.1 nodulation protein NfeD [Gammaproteobacteria bacterium]MDE2108382.1 nodulation protein NfeD [Gammaproteobacteria bacterium]MDE2461308.1 nodulation protein NfeD [Gammaproteobacteria bacterium]
MLRTLGIGFLALAAVVLNTGVAQAAANTGNAALLLHVDGAISPAMADYVVRGIEVAEQQHDQLVILEMDTPGGLDSSMRSIIKAILASPVPVVTYAAPSGSRAASAGTYILYASHVAAMAPATNLGAATPVQLAGGSSSTPAKPETAEQRKILNDALAYIRALALKRGRNADWAAQAVRNAASLTAEEALKQHVIDLVAANLPDLLAQLNGRTVSTEAGSVTLHTTGMVLRDYPRGARIKFLEVITDPTVAYLLLLLGIFGLMFEGYNPGGVLPGVVGAIALLLALYAFHVLPVNFAGLALIVLGIILFVTETFVHAYGTLSIGGLAAFVFGSIILMNTDVPGFQVSRGLIGGISVAAALIIAGTLWLTLQSRRRPVVTGAEELQKSTGEALADFSPAGDGSIRLHGEIWHAHSAQPVRAGDRVKVVGREGLKLLVAPADQTNHKEI